MSIVHLAFTFVIALCRTISSRVRLNLYPRARIAAGAWVGYSIIDLDCSTVNTCLGVCPFRFQGHSEEDVGNSELHDEMID